MLKNFENYFQHPPLLFTFSTYLMLRKIAHAEYLAYAKPLSKLVFYGRK